MANFINSHLFSSTVQLENSHCEENENIQLRISELLKDVEGLLSKDANDEINEINSKSSFSKIGKITRG